MGRNITTLILAVFTIVAGAAGILIITDSQVHLDNNGVASAQTETARLAVEYFGTGVEYDLRFAPNEPALIALNRLAQQNPDFDLVTDTLSFGEFITAVNGITAEPNVEYWQILINNEPAQLGISELTLQNGDVMQLELTSL